MAAFGFLFTVACYYPGHLSIDSGWQLAQARKGEYTDWHPPIMGVLWGYVDLLIPGAGGMLILQNLAFWGSLGVLVGMVATGPLAAIFWISAIGFFPSVFGLLSTIWKDVGMGVALLLAFALLMRAQRTRAKLPILLCIPCLLYAQGVRHNAATALPPFVLWAAYLGVANFLPKLNAKEKLRRGVKYAVILFVSLIGTISSLNETLTHGKTSYPLQQPMMFDLAGTSVEAHDAFMPDYLRYGGPPITPEDIAAIYTPRRGDDLLWYGRPEGKWGLTDDVVQIGQLTKAWKETIPHHLGAYLRHRYKFFKIFLGIGVATSCYPYQGGNDSVTQGVEFHPNVVDAWVMARLAEMQNDFYFRPWYFVALIFISGIFFIRRPWEAQLPYLILASSGLLYIFPYFLVGGACDFRYGWWTVLCALLITVYTVEGRGTGAQRSLSSRRQSKKLSS